MRGGEKSAQAESFAFVIRHCRDALLAGTAVMAAPAFLALSLGGAQAGDLINHFGTYVNHGALTVGGDLYSAYYKMETVEHFAKISLVARLLGRENLISREEVMRLQDLRGTYGTQAPAPICPDPDVAAGPGPSAAAQAVVGGDDATCQTVQAPAGTGLRLIPDLIDGRLRDAGALRHVRGESGDEAEIRLTYRELSALIEEAIRNLR